MKKSNPRSLSLKAETIRAISRADVVAVAGGVDTQRTHVLAVCNNASLMGCNTTYYLTCA